MEQIEKEIDDLYKLCKIQIEYPLIVNLNKGELNNRLFSDNSAFFRNSAFSYSACGAASVGLDWLSENGFRF